jgi:hypothetical protein
MPSPPCAFAWLLLLIAGLSLAAPILAGDPCDEDCGAHCGDCASCPLAADLDVAPVSGGLTSIDFAAVLAIHPRADFPRALDHVPLGA